MKKKLYSIITGLLIVMCLTSGCHPQKETSTNRESNAQQTEGLTEDGELDTPENPIEGAETMSMDELNRELIRRADEKPVIPDPKDN